jgi:PAS domain S-box-containing protein
MRTQQQTNLQTSVSDNLINILAVDDNPTNLVALEAALGSLGQNLVKAYSGEEALKRLLEKNFALILLDVQMPGMDGFETAKLIRERERTRHVPIVFLTAAYQSDSIKGYSLGAVDYLLKPIVPEILRTKVGVFVELFRRAEQIRLQEQMLRERAEEALSASEASYRLLFDNNPRPMWVFDAKTLAFLAVNDAAIEKYGYCRAEFLRMTIKDIRPPEDVEVLMDNLMKAPEVLENAGNFRHRKKDGSVIEVEIASHELCFEGKPARLVLANDVTEKKELESQLRQSQKLEGVGQLAGGIAHDFNNLLTVILGRSQMLQKKLEKASPLQRDVNLIHQTAERAASLTRQLLAFSRKQLLHPKVLDLNTVVADMDKMLQRLIGEHIEFATVLHPGLGRVKVDPGQMEQVIMNLAVNARDAMPQGGKLMIETGNAALDEAYTRQHMRVQPGRYVMLAVTDAGCGMDSETQTRIFEPFFTTKEPGKGTGLGLSTVYGIVKQSGGNVWVYSEVGRGSTFKIYLPRVDDEADQVSAIQESDRKIKGTETILLVEDEEAVRELSQEILREEGYQVLVASNGVEALHLCQHYNGSIDLVVTDVVMPKMSGPELARQLSSIRPAAKTLFLSGYTNASMTQNDLLSPEVEFLQKPFSTEAFTGKVRQILDAAVASHNP